MRTDPQIASHFESCALPSWTANEDLRSFLAGFLQQLDVDGSDIVNNRIAIDYILELTSDVTSRFVEPLRLSARCATRRRCCAGNRADMIISIKRLPLCNNLIPRNWREPA
jgi:hypothetical protein